ncbi:MAG: hypothetical protein R6W48_04115 [Gaiellaceae bacterium]
MARSGGAAWGAIAAGLASIVTLPAAIYLTRYSDAYELLHAAFGIPVAGILGVVAVVLARRERRRAAIALGRGDGARGVRLGYVLGVVGICMAAAALVAIGVYGLLEYVGSRE